MLQLAAPLGLLALGALLVPLLLHLVRRPLRVVRVGSLRLLEGERHAVRSLRWHDRLLLALRCGLLAALALALAGLRWQPGAPSPARWLLSIPGATLDAASRAEWERLRSEGYEPRLLARGFSVVDSTHTHAPVAAETTTDVWSLLRELDARLPAGSRAVVFGPTQATLFRGTRPTLAHVDVRWHATPNGDPPPASPPARVGLIASPNRAEDARYLRAAFAAVGAIVVTDGAPEWIFQLGNAAMPAAWDERVRDGARLITDAPDATRRVSVTRWFDAGGTMVRLRQRVPLDTGVPVWRDSQGEPLYTEERRARGVHGRFALRFHLDWSDWPLGSAFPAWWREQFHPSANPALTLAPEQAAPAYAPAAVRTPSALPGYGRVDLRAWCWLLAVALFVVERFLSRTAPHGRAKA